MKKEETEKDCRTCAHSRFDETWGEYKCVKKKKKIRSLGSACGCEDYKKGEPMPTNTKDIGVDEIMD